jgi:hypothetical protein
MLRRNPGAFTVWTGLYLLLGVAPSLAIWWRAGPEYVDLFRAMIAAGGKVDPAIMAPLNAKIGGLNNLILLCQLVISSVLGAAMFRAVLRPSESASAYLRFGVAELSIGAAIIIYYLALIAMTFVFSLVVVVPAVMIGAGSPAAGIGFGVIMGVVALLACAWIMIRLAFSLPMIVADGRFRLFEGWRASRPVQGKLVQLVLAFVGVYLLALIVVLGIEVTVLAAVVAASGLDAPAFFNRPGAAVVHDLLPVLSALALVMGVFTWAIQTIFAGAWADAYRQVAPGQADVFA